MEQKLTEINERIDKLDEKYSEVNLRYLALEGKMSTFERVNDVEKANKDKILTQILFNQEANAERIRKMELRIATYVGGLAVLGVILKIIVK